MRPRDSQKGRVYAAERKAFIDRFVFRDVGTEAKSQARVNEIMASKWMADHYPRAVARWSPPVVRFNSRMRGAQAFSRAIDIGATDFARTEWVLIHELGHVINHRVNYDASGHGWQYCGIYLALVSRFLSAVAADALKAEFKALGVRYTKPRAKRELSPEQRAVLVARLAANRKPRVAKTLWQRAFDGAKVRGYITHALNGYGWLRLYIGTEHGCEYIIVERLSGRPTAPRHHGTHRVDSPIELDAMVAGATSNLW